MADDVEPLSTDGVGESKDVGHQVVGDIGAPAPRPGAGGVPTLIGRQHPVPGGRQTGHDAVPRLLRLRVPMQKGDDPAVSRPVVADIEDELAVSVLVQLVADRTGFHPVSRNVFRPKPNVDSALVAFRRRGGLPADYARLKAVVGAAFAHRRKTLPNSLELVGIASRAAAASALEEIGRGAAARAEELRPEEFVALAQALP